MPNEIQIAAANFRGKTVFTSEYNYYEARYGWEATAFIAHCVSQWGDEFEHLLDCRDKGLAALELDVVDYWGPTFVKKFRGEYPSCDAAWYRDIYRAILRSLVLPRELIDKYFEKVGYEADEVSGREYLERHGRYLGMDVKPLPSDWLRIGYLTDGELVLGEDVVRLAGEGKRGTLVKTISWILSGFMKNFDILIPATGNAVHINTDLCNLLSRNYPEHSGKGSLEGRWFEEIFRARFLSIRIPADLLKSPFAEIRQDN